MPAKTDRRRSRERRQREAIVDLFARGLPAEEIAVRTKTSARHVERILRAIGLIGN